MASCMYLGSWVVKLIVGCGMFLVLVFFIFWRCGAKKMSVLERTKQGIGGGIFGSKGRGLADVAIDVGCACKRPNCRCQLA